MNTSNHPPRSPETREKDRLAKLAYWSDPIKSAAQREKIRQMGKKSGPHMKEYWANPENKEKTRQLMKEGKRKSSYVFTEEHKKNLSIARRNRKKKQVENI
jgi:predicted RNA-binding protein